MSDIELRSVDTSTAPLMRSLCTTKTKSSTGPSGGSTGLITSAAEEMEYAAESVPTDFGPVYVVKAGAPPNTGKPYIITYHDLGLNFASNFQAFFNFCDMKLLLRSFSVLNVHAPGQEEAAPPLPDDYRFPTMDQLAEQVDQVCKHYGVISFIGFGVGAGANVLSRYALRFPEMVDGLFLIHATATQASWTEWFYQKMNLYYMSTIGMAFGIGGPPTSAANTGGTGGMPQSVHDYLMWHHFGRVTDERNLDLVALYRRYFADGRSHNIRNLSLFIDAYVRRTDLGIERIAGTFVSPTANSDSSQLRRQFKCTVLLLCGSLSPHVDDTVEMNGRLDPRNSTWMKLSDCGMTLEEQPGKVFEAFRLFLQGLGYALSAYDRRHRGSLNRGRDDDGDAGDDDRRRESNDCAMHIVENPIAIR